MPLIVDAQAQPITDTWINTKELVSVAGGAVTGRSITSKLHVSPDGNGTDGSTWDKAFTTIQDALDAASTDANDLTLILLAPIAGFYDIDAVGDPTWAGNYEIVGPHRLWSPIKNSDGGATSVMKFTGKISLTNLAIFQDSTNNCDGIVFTNHGFRIRKCGFNSEGVNGAVTAIHIDGSGGMTQGGIIDDIQVIGHVTHTKGLHIDKSRVNEFRHMHLHKCLTGIHIDDALSDYNHFEVIDIGDCATGIDIDAGNEHLFDHILFHHNTNNVLDDIGDSTWNNIGGELDVTLEPDNFTGVTVATGGAGDAWTAAPVEIRAALTATKPFKIVATIVEANAAEKFRIHLSADGGLTWFDDISIEGEVNAQKRSASVAPTATDHIFNKGTQIVAEAKCESGGNSTVVWLELQVI